MKPTLSIVLPTGGTSAHLPVTAAATATQLEDGDELLIVRKDCPWGHAARQEAMARCAGTHLLWIDDDDLHPPGVLAKVRELLARQPDRVHIFAMRSAADNGQLIPSLPLVCGGVGTPMFVVPNVPGKLGTWSDRYQGDFDFIASTMRLRKDKPVLHREIVLAIINAEHLRKAA